MENIKLNKNTTIDLAKLIDSRLLVQANSGGGKSWLLRRILEQSHGKVQQIVIDLEGEFSTLREKYDYILAGKGGDTPAEPKSAALLAKKILELNVSAIIDLYELNHYDRKRFVKLFLDAIVNAPKNLWHPVLIVVDEAHVFCPEKGSAESSEAVIDLMTRGRKRGYCGVLATQRISKLHKDAAAECNNKLIGRTGLDIDMKRASEELGFNTKEQMLSLRKLEAGEFYSFGTALSNEVTKIKVGDVKTSHPKAGSRIMTKVAPPTDKMKTVLKKLTDLPEEAQKEAITIKDLKTQIGEYKRHRCPKVTSQVDIDRAVKIAELNKERGFDAERTGMIKQTGNFLRIIHQIAKIVEPHIKDKIEIKKAEPLKVITREVIQQSKVIKQHESDVIIVNASEDFKISSSQQKILDALSFLASVNIEPAPKIQVALFAGVSSASSGYSNNVSALRTSGLLTYPGPGQIELTEEGRDIANPQDIPTTDDELHRQLFSRLSGSQQKILQSLIDNYPNEISKVELAELAGQSATSSGYSNNISRLRSLKLIDYPFPGMVVALPILFLEI